MIRGLLLLLLLPAVTVTVDGPGAGSADWEERVAVLTRQVDRALGFEYEGAIRVRLARTDAEFREAAGDPPEWAAAIARPRDSLLVVRMTAVGPRTGTDVSGILRHELVHLLLPARVGGFRRVPLWFEEGLAQVLGARILRVSDARLEMAAAAGRLLPLEALEETFPRGRSTAGMAYAQSESVVRMLIDEGGIESIHLLLDRTRDSGSFTDALSDTFDVTVADLEADWRKWLDRDGRPWWIDVLLANWWTFLFFSASLLVIVAWARARRKKQDTYESLPE
jgi:hypothetical protein